MMFDEYQDKAVETAIYPGQGTALGLLYCALGLSEAGEIQGKVKKLLRDEELFTEDEDDFGDIVFRPGLVSRPAREALSKELGDVLWYVAQMATELDLNLADIAEQNLERLTSRKRRGVLQGSGDNR